MLSRSDRERRTAEEWLWRSAETQVPARVHVGLLGVPAAAARRCVPAVPRVHASGELFGGLAHPAGGQQVLADHARWAWRDKLIAEMLGVRNEQKEEEYAFLCSQLAEVLIAARTIQRTQSVAQNVTPEPHQPDEFKIRLHALQEGIAALQMHIDESEKPHQDDQMLRSPTPMEEEDACEETADEPLSAKAHGEECVVLLLPLLTASLRQVKYVASKMLAMSMLTDLTKYLSNDVILQRVLPPIMNVLSEGDGHENVEHEEEYASVMSLVGDDGAAHGRRSAA